MTIDDDAAVTGLFADQQRVDSSAGKARNQTAQDLPLAEAHGLGDAALAAQEAQVPQSFGAA